MRISVITCLSMVMACLYWCSGAGAQTCELIYRWELGETLSTRLTIDQERRIRPLPTYIRDDELPPSKDRSTAHRARDQKQKPKTQPGQAADQVFEFGSASHKLICEFDVKTTEVDPDGNARLEMTLKRVEATSDQADGERFTFDSSKQGKALPSPGRAETLAALVGRTITLRMSRDGRMLDSTGIGALVEGLVALQEDDAIGGLLLRGMQDNNAGSSIDDLFRMGPRFLPGRPVQRGDSWTTEVEQLVPIVGTVKSTWDSRLESIKSGRAGRVARIKSLARIKIGSVPTGGVGQLPGVELSFLPGKGEAETVFNIDTGRAISAELSQEISVSVRLAQPDADATDGAIQTLSCRMKNEVIDAPKR